MFALLVEEDVIKKVRDNPRAMHWTQSPLEEVKSAEILSEGADYVLTRTRFLAPVMVAYSEYRTEDIGEAFGTIVRAVRNVTSGDGEEYWAYLVSQAKEAIRLSYGKNLVPHLDYTLLQYDDIARVLINLRQYPKGSFLVDMIDASVEGNAGDEDRIRGSRISVRTNHNLNLLKPFERTMTLDEMIELNRVDSIELTGNEGKSIVPISSLRDIDYLYNQGVRGVGDIKTKYLGEVALQNRLLSFKTKLIECSVPYRC